MPPPAAALPSKVSFTVRRPTPAAGSSGPDSESEGGFKVPAIPRRITESGRSTPASPLASGAIHTNSQVPRQFEHNEDDSSDEEKENVDELITDFDHQRLNGNKENGGPIIIPALANRNWREVARKRKAAVVFAPDMSAMVAEHAETTVVEVSQVTEEAEDEKAMRALIAEARGQQETDDSFMIESLPDEQQRPMTEADAYRRDVVTLPDEASLDDYERIPVEQFGAALLRGMGWKPGQAASRTRKGLAEPYLPQARPSLLGLGAKERVIPDDGSSSKKRQKPERRYIPLVKKELDDSGKESVSSSRRSSRSPPRRDGYKDRDRRRDGDRDRDRDRDRRRDYRERDRDREDDRQDKRDRNYDSGRYRDREGRR